MGKNRCRKFFGDFDIEIQHVRVRLCSKVKRIMVRLPIQYVDYSEVWSAAP